MKKTILKTFGIVTIASLAACSTIPKQAYYNRGQPESLLEASSEEITIDLSQRTSSMQLADIISKNNPTSAQLICSNEMLCDKAADVLNQYGVSYDRTRGLGNTAVLSMDNVIAHDCQNRFITNHNNPYNLNHTTFGCSVAVNQVQMVSDKRQYVDPMLLGPYDGQKAAQNYDNYLSREAVELEEQSTQEAVQ